MKTLVLNSSFEFLGFCDWKEAICMAYTGKVYVEEEYDRIVSSPSVSMHVPAVVRLRHYVRVAYERITYVSYSKRNVHLRDNWTCQYCGEKKPADKLGIDHVIPESRGGLNTWTNTVSCCKGCNNFKDARLPNEAGMKLLRVPDRPKGFREIIQIKLGEIHELWEKYIWKM